MRFPDVWEELLFRARLWPPERWLVVYVARRWAASITAMRDLKRAYRIIDEQRRAFQAFDAALGGWEDSECPVEDVRTPGTDFTFYEAGYSEILLQRFAVNDAVYFEKPNAVLPSPATLRR